MTSAASEAAAAGVGAPRSSTKALSASPAESPATSSAEAAEAGAGDVDGKASLGSFSGCTRHTWRPSMHPGPGVAKALALSQSFGWRGRSQPQWYATLPPPFAWRREEG